MTQPVQHASIVNMVAVWFITTLFVVFVGLGGTYILDDTPGLGRVFDGIGGLSGGGVSFIAKASVVFWSGFFLTTICGR